MFIKKFNEINKILRLSTKPLIFKILAAFFGILLSILISRKLGSESLGTYTLFINFVTIFSFISLLGLRFLVLKEAPYFFKIENYQMLNNLRKTGYVLVYFISILLFCLLVFFNYSLEPIFENNVLLILLPFLVLQGLIKLYSGFANAFNKFWQSVFDRVNSGTIVVFLVCLLLILIEIVITIEIVLLIFLFERLLSLIFLRKIFNQNVRKSSKTNFIFNQYKKQSLLFFLVLGSSIIYNNIDSILIGFFLGNTEVGLYSSAVRVSILISFMLTIFNNIITPKVSVAFKEKNFDGLNKLINHVFNILLSVGIILLAILIFSGEFILGFWGNEFKSMFSVLIILASGQFINLICGPCGLLLMLSGNEMVHLKISFFSIIMCVFLNITLINYYGITGCAIATFLTISIENFLKLYFCKRYTGISVIPFLER